MKIVTCIELEEGAAKSALSLFEAVRLKTTTIWGGLLLLVRTDS